MHLTINSKVYNQFYKTNKQFNFKDVIGQKRPFFDKYTMTAAKPI